MRSHAAASSWAQLIRIASMPRPTSSCTSFESPAASRVRFASISLDPLHDTPGALRERARKSRADLPGLSFLTGSSDRADPGMLACGFGSSRRPDRALVGPGSSP